MKFINREEFRKAIRARMKIQRADLTDEQIEAVMDEIEDVADMIPLMGKKRTELIISGAFSAGVLFAMSGFNRTDKETLVFVHGSDK